MRQTRAKVQHRVHPPHGQRLAVPLKKGSSKKVVSENISELVHAHYPQSQAVAVAMSEKRKAEKKGGKKK